MTNNGYRGGTSSAIKYAYEDPDVWGQDADSMTESDETMVAFGQGVTFNYSHSNNKARNYGTGQRNAESTSALNYSGTLSINGSVTNFYWLLGALGANANGGSGPSSYTHTYTEANSLPSFSARAMLDLNTDTYVLFQGCLINQITLTAAVNETTKFTLDCPFRYSSNADDTFSAASDSQSVYTFAGGTIEIPNGTAIAAIQNFTLTVNNNVEMVNKVGSRFADGYVAKERAYDFSMTVSITDLSLLKKFYNGTSGIEPGTTDGEIASMELTFENADGHTCVFLFGATHFNDDGLAGNPTETIKEDITGWSESLTSAIYTNATELAPAEADNV
jgi:hypothetical protein